MTCLTCGAAMKTRKENYRYDECGLPGITLVGIEVSRCPKCGEHEAAIPHIEELHRSIAHVVARKPQRLDSQELKFLRKFLGWSGKDFAAHMGVNPSTVSRWEQRVEPMGAAADRALRLMVFTVQPADDYTLDYLKAIGAGEPKPLRVELKISKRGWKAAA